MCHKLNHKGSSIPVRRCGEVIPYTIWLQSRDRQTFDFQIYTLSSFHCSKNGQAHAHRMTGSVAFVLTGNDLSPNLMMKPRSAAIRSSNCNCFIKSECWKLEQYYFLSQSREPKCVREIGNIVQTGGYL